MGSYCVLYIADFPVHSSKSYVDPFVMSIFRESDKLVQERSINLRNSIFWGVSDDEEDFIETAVEYKIKVMHAKDRLNVMGFTLSNSKKAFEDGISSILNLSENSGYHDVYCEKINFCKNINFKNYLKCLKEIYDKKIYLPSESEIYSDDEMVNQIFKNFNGNGWSGYDDFYLGFPAQLDIRYFLRVFLEILDLDSWVIYELSELVSSGYYDVDDEVCVESISYLNAIDPSSKVLVITEGSTDKNILEKSLELLYPHLKDYYHFMDFGVSSLDGGAPALVKTVKAFIGANIRNRVVGLFDNDTAAKNAVNSLDKVEIPCNVKILHYPCLSDFEKYPTIGPSGFVEMDVNGLACSIEMYLGDDVKRDPDGKLIPIHWKGFDQTLKQYQGEILQKSFIQKNFYKKIDSCLNDRNTINSRDWAGVDAILRLIFNAFN